MIKRKKVLVCPLNWGLGHAARCVPIINELLEQGADVYVGADKGPYELLIREFPTVKFITFPGLRIKYPPGILFIPFMFYLFPKMLIQINKEHKFLQELMNEYNFDIVISDNRYGIWNRAAKTVFMTHQVVIKTDKLLEKFTPIFFKISKYFIKNFDQLWIPDVEGENNLSGDLAHSYIIKNKTQFIGILSRFHKTLLVQDYKSSTADYKSGTAEKYKYDICVIISGPEPQRTNFEKLIIHQIEKTSLHAVIITGTPDKQMKPLGFGNGIIYPHLNGVMMQAVIEASGVVISRSGYTTIMDLAVMGKKAIFMPTPGQTEQEYLAEMLMKKGLIYYQKQKDFDLLKALEEVKNYKGLAMESNTDVLTKVVKTLLS
jgi:predicted glycosyltransferase